MIEKKNFTTIIIFICAIAFSFWFIAVSKSIINKKNSSQSYNIFIDSVKVTQLNKIGKSKDILTATKVFDYTQKNKTNFNNPFITHYVQNAPPWHITAKHGQSINNNTTIILQDHVKVHQLAGLNSHNLTLTTTKLTYYPKKSLIITHQPVIITQPGSIMHAHGMKMDLNKNVVTFISNVHGQYGKISKK
jgi:LPS export ABC transporter protein LptC